MSTPPPSRNPHPRTALYRLLRLIGRLIGKALKDNRMVDLPLALPLCSLLVGLRRRREIAAPVGARAAAAAGAGAGAPAAGGVGAAAAAATSTADVATSTISAERRAGSVDGGGVGGGGWRGGDGGGARPLTLSDVGQIDAALGRSLESLATLAGEVERAKVREGGSPATTESFYGSPPPPPPSPNFL